MLETIQETTHQLTERPPTYDAVDLTKGGGIAQIKLRDQLYTLRVTRAGKLILTK